MVSFLSFQKSGAIPASRSAVRLQIVYRNSFCQVKPTGDKRDDLTLACSRWIIQIITLVSLTGKSGEICMQSFIVDPDTDGKSLVRAITGHYPGLGANRVYQALRRKDIRLNGRRLHANCTVAAGDLIALYLTDDQLTGADDGENRPVPETAAPYSIVYQDQLILIVNKKLGVTVHPAVGDKPQGPFLLDLIRQDMQNPAIELCHRLDRQTGGLLVLALRPAGLAAVRDLMQSGRLVKHYRCLVRGVPAQGSPVRATDGSAMLELAGWLEKVASRSDVFIHDEKCPGDLPIITRYKVLRIIPSPAPDQENLSELEVELVTGRTHQIRAHLAHIGHPLLGDGKYGRNSFNRHFLGQNGQLRRQQLFATRLAFAPDCEGPLAYLAGRTFEIEPEYDWPGPGQVKPQ